MTLHLAVVGVLRPKLAEITRIADALEILDEPSCRVVVQDIQRRIRVLHAELGAVAGNEQALPESDFYRPDKRPIPVEVTR